MNFTIAVPSFNNEETKMSMRDCNESKKINQYEMRKHDQVI